MDIEWSTLGGVFGVSLGITVLVVVMFSLGIAAWARGGAPHPGAAHGGPDKVAAATALLCFAACLAIAAYGIELIIPG
ncbi:hypothetical protein [Streptomyces sp. NPDC005336]|uniref:hypothetical protein n=1 Tax=unclassified Streptomyces TaxID=2593676 RepID=UPI0033AF95F0